MLTYDAKYKQFNFESQFGNLNDDGPGYSNSYTSYGTTLEELQDNCVYYWEDNNGGDHFGGKADDNEIQDLIEELWNEYNAKEQVGV